jgi:hypothetical protein
MLSSIIMLTACDPTSQPVENQSKSDTQQLTVNPRQVTTDSTITINIPNLKPKNFAIQSPTGNLFIVHNQAENILLMEQERWESADHIDLPIASTKGLIWIAGDKTEKLVFNETGEYILYFADNLETEPENTFSMQKKILFTK